MDGEAMLDSYLRKAVNPNNDDLDVSAFDQFCLKLKTEPRLITVALQLLVERIHSSNTKEALLALEALEECMETCGEEFRAEINKFRFLNELIRLVSKKHHGDKTSKEVSGMILNILLTWTNKYDKFKKIEAAYNMLKTQGIEHHPQKNVVVQNTPKNKPSTGLDEKEFTKLRALIHSTKQEDRDKANLLIQNFYRDDERRTAIKDRRVAELQKVSENVKLLDEMLSQYQPGETSEEELAIIHEIYESCEKINPTIDRLAQETQHSEGMLERIYDVYDNLTHVLKKYRQLIPSAQQASTKPRVSVNSTTALQSKVSTETSQSTNISGSDPLDTLFDVSTIPSSSEAPRSAYDDLSEIFSTTVSTDEIQNVKSDSAKSLMSAINTDTILTPLVMSSQSSAIEAPRVPTANALDKYNDIIVSCRNVPTNGEMNKKSPNTSTNSTQVNVSTTAKSIPDLDVIVNGMKSTLLSQHSDEIQDQQCCVSSSEEDEIMLKPTTPEEEETPESLALAPTVSSPAVVVPKKEFKSLAEIVIDLDNIQPSKEPSRTVLDEKDGLQITLNFASDHPRADVAVIVISTINQGRIGIPSFYFDASVRKPGKLRLLPASGTSLPGTKPFRPPAEGITQVLLLANPSGEPVDLTCILTYCIGDDPDPIKESIVMERIPFVRE
ncbi:ADP-ribosylation factor-binding protein GGA2 isoform X2 [Toxorhynchites rutilus septentrionalis]|uniref:ADP-ribosylation factor-binding protein GGA2 isoform X2 n=1 Tax=Toxorhynchites rutilus septentrionalis TaxID=329112 RepID=UPI00247ACDA7|nr:ADP-ribosylation factor-binding protein GGA2 isoform X2 [Toxorhynchites rutilus septentrionalis]